LLKQETSSEPHILHVMLKIGENMVRKTWC